METVSSEEIWTRQLRLSHPANGDFEKAVGYIGLDFQGDV